VAKLSIFAFATLLCFASCAFAQDTVNAKMSVGTPALLSLSLDWGNGGNGNGGNGNGGNGCGNQGHDGWGWGGNGGGNGNCNNVPEGGTTLTYLSLAGLGCFGALVFRSRRPASLPGTNS
jgi:hypothetical protein